MSALPPIDSRGFQHGDRWHANRHLRRHKLLDEPLNIWDRSTRRAASAREETSSLPKQVSHVRLHRLGTEEQGTRRSPGSSCGRRRAVRSEASRGSKASTPDSSGLPGCVREVDALAEPSQVRTRRQLDTLKGTARLQVLRRLVVASSTARSGCPGLRERAAGKEARQRGVDGHAHIIGAGDGGKRVIGGGGRGLPAASATAARARSAIECATRRVSWSATV